MRHRVAGRKLSRTSAHRKALRRNLVASLFEHGAIRTTLPRAKEVLSMAEKLITLARQQTLHARRRAVAILQDRDIIKEDEKVGTVVGKLFSEIAPRYADRPGGYTRIIRMSNRRIGDGSQLAMLQLIGEENASASEGGKKKKKGKKSSSQSE